MMEEQDKQIRVEVRCKTCGRLLCYKMTAASGLVEMKCTKCGKTEVVNLALRKRRYPIQCRRAKTASGYLPPLLIAN